MNRGRYIVIAVVAVTAVVLSIVVFSMLNNDPPVITSLEAATDRVSPSGSTDIVCVASSAGGAELEYEWSASGGVIQGTGASVTWIAAASEGEYAVSVIVTDSRGATASDSVSINVTSNRPPGVDSLTADTEWVFPSGSLRVACSASDPDGHELRYEWTATGGDVSGTDSEVTWTAPEDLGQHSITVTVTDGHGGSDTETLSVKVMPDQPPVIEALVVTKDRHEHCYLQKASFGYHVGKEQKYDIDCVVSETVPDTTIERFYDLFYEWEWPEGEVSETSADGSVITWTAPNKSVYTTITVTVSDMAGNTASASVDLNVVSCSVCRFGYCP
ncbi:MAG: Ig-like domain-containing protein [Dehalococcoidia bacterium]